MTVSVWAVVISTCTLFATVISPIITTILNNRYQMKIRNQDFYDRHRAEVIENYIRYAGSLSKQSSATDDFRNFGKYSKEIYLYLPEKFWGIIDSIQDSITEYKYGDASNSLATLCKALNEHPPRLENGKRNCKIN